MCIVSNYAERDQVKILHKETKDWDERKILTKKRKIETSVKIRKIVRLIEIFGPKIS